MQGISKQYKRVVSDLLAESLTRNRSILLLGPRQTGKTTLVKEALVGRADVMAYPLQDPRVRIEIEKDPALLVRQVEARGGNPLVFIDEAQKVPSLFDGVQWLIDERRASFVITGSSARKLRRKGMNLLPGRIDAHRLDPLLWSELGWCADRPSGPFPLANIDKPSRYGFEKSLVFGNLPGIVALATDGERAAAVRSYTQIYLEEEIRAEALSRKIGAFGRFLELAAAESGSSPNLTKLSMEAGVSAPTIREFYRILEDTLVAERVDPFLRNARKRILASPRYYLFDNGVRNALARAPLTSDLLSVEKGRLFEHAVVLEILRRIRALGLDHRVCWWRTSGGAEVDCVIDAGDEVIPIEIKAGVRVPLSELRGLTSFIESYPKLVRRAYVVTMGERPEKLTGMITALPWRYL